MQIRIYLSGDKAYSLSFGWNTRVHQSMDWFSITTLYFDKYGAIDGARLHISWFRHPKFWFNNRFRKYFRERSSKFD